MANGSAPLSVLPTICAAGPLPNTSTRVPTRDCRTEPENPERVIEILRKGLSGKVLRNRADVLEKLAEFLYAQGRASEAESVWQEFEQEDAKLSSDEAAQVVSSKNKFDSSTMAMLKDAIVSSADDELAHATAPSDTVGRKEPCPCGSGKKYKRCCGK